MEALKSHEHLYLLLDSAEAPMHASTLFVYDGDAQPPGLDAIRTFMAERVARARVLRRRLATPPLGMARPYWVDEARVDIAAHVTEVELRAPGGWNALCAEAAHLHARALDPARPLWHAYVITGLDRRDPMLGGNFAILLKAHCATHGETLSVQLFAALHELSPATRASPPKIAPRHDRAPTLVGLASRTAIDAVQRPLAVYRDAMLQWRPWLAYGAAQASDFAQRLLGRGEAGLSTPAPVTRFNGRVHSARSVGGASYARSDVERIRDRVPGATSDDVGIAIVAGGLARYLATSGAPPERDLVAEAPLAHHPGAPRFGSGSFADSALLSLHTRSREPLARLSAIVAQRHQRRTQQRAIGARKLMLDAMDLTPAVALRAAGKIAHRLRLGSLIAPIANTTITAIHAPDVPLYFAGAKLAGFYGLPPVHDLAGVAHAISVGHRKVTIAFASCATMLSDPQSYERCLRDAYAELAGACATRAARRVVAGRRRSDAVGVRPTERQRLRRIV